MLTITSTAVGISKHLHQYMDHRTCDGCRSLVFILRTSYDCQLHSHPSALDRDLASSQKQQKAARGTTCGRVPHSGNAGPHAVVILAGRRIILHVLDPAVPDGVQRRKVRLALHRCWQPGQQPQQYGPHWLAECPESTQELYLYVQELAALHLLRA